MMKIRILLLCLAVALLTQGCAHLLSLGEKPDLVAVVTADKEQIRFGEKLVLTLRITNSTQTTAEFGDDRKVKIRGELNGVECPFPCCMLGLYCRQENSIQAASSLGEFQVPAGQTYEISKEIVLSRDSYPFPAGLYLGELQGKPRNWQQFRYKVTEAIVKVTD